MISAFSHCSRDPVEGGVHDIGLQPLLVQVAQEVSEQYPDTPVYIIAYRDNVHFVGPVDPAVWAKQSFAVLRQKVSGVEIVHAKAAAYHSTDVFDKNDLLLTSIKLTACVPTKRISTDGLCVLGTPIGN